jgi:CRISPR-associated protein Cst1
MLRYTGHPFIDVGVATITAFAGVEMPEDVEDWQIEGFVNYAIDIYMAPTMAGYLAMVTFANPSYANPGLINNPKFDAQRRHTLTTLLNLWQWQSGKPRPEVPSKEVPADEGERCIFSQEPALIRVSQGLMPMIGGGSAINFFPEGRPRLPVSGWCLLALLAMPLGTLNSSGKTFLVHCHNSETSLELVRLNLNRNRDAFQMQGLVKRPNYKFPKTSLIRDLVDTGAHTHRNTSITAYLFITGGQNPRIEIFHLPSSVLNFMSLATKLYPHAWQEVVARAWESQKPTNREEGIIEYAERNFFYEDLFNLPREARRFLRRYLLRYRRSGKENKTDPRFQYSFIKEREVISWGLIGLFLERVMDMDKARIEAVKQLGDRLATYIQTVDARFYKRLYIARNDYQMRRELLIAANNAKGKHYETLLPYEEFITVFFSDDGDTAQPDWYLARDLLMIRIIEQLSIDWIQEHDQDLQDVAAAESETQE